MVRADAKDIVMEGSERNRMRRGKFSTSTIADGQFVPWLAAAGELAYTPQAPPERDYHFQYSWIIPGIFRSDGTVRRHFWFGSPWKESTEVRLLFDFWNKARDGAVDQLFLSNGSAIPRDVKAPLGVYRHSGLRLSMGESLIAVQHGSYLIAALESQPLIDRGEAVLYRGVQKARVFTLQRLTTSDTRSRLMTVHARSLEDSVVSFNAAHCNVSRTETGYFNDRSFLFGKLCENAGLDLNPSITRLLYSGYALEEWCAERKFGPNYVKLRTPLTNIRISTFVCNETEVKVIDPNKLDVMECVGCRVRETYV